jgi:hypothetical protein
MTGAGAGEMTGAAAGAMTGARAGEMTGDGDGATGCCPARKAIIECTCFRALLQFHKRNDGSYVHSCKSIYGCAISIAYVQINADSTCS